MFGTAHNFPTGYHQPSKQRHQVFTISSRSPSPQFFSNIEVGQPRKQIDVHVNVSRHAPTDGTCNCPVDSGLVVPIGVDEQIPIYVYISVRDSGPGLHPKDLELLVSGCRSNKAPSTHSLLVSEVPARLSKYGPADWFSFTDHKVFRIHMRCLEAPD
jgi:hypothetical protein